MRIKRVSTRPFADQKPGTAGLRKRVQVFKQPHYLENFVQAVLESLDGLQGASLVVGGDGRYHNREAIGTVLRMAAAHGVGRIIVGQGGLLSTPAASHLIRRYRARGGFVLTASHNPAGPEGDFGIKFNVANGGQASETLTTAIHRRTRSLQSYQIADLPDIDIDRPGVQTVDGLEIAVVDPVEDYAALMETLFDFDAISDWLQGPFRMRFDAMHGITGPYARRILEQRLGAPAGTVVNAEPLPDFGGGHPDPNLTYARELAEAVIHGTALDFGAASDGDGDRNMILGRGRFVSPGDSLAVLLAHAHRIPGYREGVRGVARSMPTSRAADRVARDLGLPCFETPTGWRFFCNLLDAERIDLCGEESFGTGSSHVREKDGLWAVLFWLNLLALLKRPVADILREHWRTYGRHYYVRHDYIGLDDATAAAVMDELRGRFGSLDGRDFGALRVTQADEFSYHDPVDGSESHHQGLRVVFGDSARIVLRMSGTGTDGATLRLYLERFETRPDALDRPVSEVLAPVAEIAEELAGIRRHSGRERPSLVT